MRMRWVVIALALAGCGARGSSDRGERGMGAADVARASAIVAKIRAAATDGAALAEYQGYRAGGGAPSAPAARSLAVRIVTASLGDGAAATRAAAARAAARVPELRAALAAHAGDSDPVVRAEVARARGDAATLLTLTDGAGAAVALDALAALAPARARAAALARVRDADPAVQAAALEVLGAAGERADGEVVVSVLSSAADGHTRAVALRALAAIPGAGAAAAQVARDALTDRYPGARLAALSVLDQVLGIEAPATLKNIAGGADLSLRVHAAVLLWRRGAHDTARAALASVLASPQGAWTARAAALNAADGWQDADFGALADAGERDPAPGVRLAAGRLLLDIGGRERAIAIWSALLALTADPTDAASELTYTQIQAAAELARAHSDLGPGALDGFAAAGAPSRAAALAALGNIPGAPRDSLVAGLSDPTVALTAAAAILHATR